METPIADFLAEYAESDVVRLHMPGHKGRPLWPVGRPGQTAGAAALEAALGAVHPYDITEIKGADALYEAADGLTDGIIAASEQNASALYGSGLTAYSASGSTLCVQTMLALACRPGGKLVAARNSHSSFFHACALLDLTPVWVSPEYNDGLGVSGEVSVEAVRRALEREPEAQAVYLTSPDYLGCISRVRSVAAVCRAMGKPLLVDNAHGAHLKFLSRDQHPLALGASMCCDSAHKSLPVLTGGAYLHIGRELPPAFKPPDRGAVKRMMAVFATTSPSYLILLSLDLCNRYLAERGRADFARLEERAADFAEKMGKRGFAPVTARMDPAKLTFDANAVGLTGWELADYFRAQGVECEYASTRHVVLMLSPFHTPGEMDRLAEAIREIPKGVPICPWEEPVPLPKRVVSLREATFAPRRRLPVELTLGRVAAETKTKCPPGVPIVAAGEEIDEDTQKLLKRSGILELAVIE